MSETPHHHCVSNRATLREKICILSYQICKYSCMKKKNTFTYIGSLGTLYTLFLKNNQIFYISQFFSFYIVYNE